MKTLIALAICISLVFYAGETLSESDEICCTWVNSKYETGQPGQPPQKIMFHYDGTYATYNTESSTDALTKGTFTIVKKWTDSDEQVWYKIVMYDPTKGKNYKLAKVSKDGKKLEFVCKSDKYPTEINPAESGYCNYVIASTN